MFQPIQAFIKDDTRKGKYRKWMITAIVFLVLMTLAIIIIPWRETWQTLLNSNLVIIGFAVLLTIPYQLFSTASYYLVASQQKVSQSYWYIFKINLIMIFYDIVLPSTFFVSGLRWYRYNQHSKKPAQILTSIAYLKAYNILLTVLLSLGLLLFFKTTTFQGYTLGFITLIIGIALILFFTPILCKKILTKLPAPMSSQAKPVLAHVLYDYFFRVVGAFANFRTLNLKTQLLLFMLGIASQAALYYAYILCAESVGIRLSFAQLGAIRATLLLVANLPINFSVGISLRDVTLISMLAAINVPLDKAAAMSIVVLVKSYIFGIIGGIIEALEIIKKKRLEIPPDQ